MRDSRIPGFYRMSLEKRIDAIVERDWLDAETAAKLKSVAPLLDRDGADHMIENVIGVFGLPLALAPNFRINDRDVVVPMVVEEPSIVAGVSSAARLAREGGGFRVTGGDSLLAGQILLIEIDNPQRVIAALESAREDLLALANSREQRLVARGGGARSMEFFAHELSGGQVAVALHLLVDTRDAMGANIVNTMCEYIAPEVERCTGGRAVLKILSNLADRALVTARLTLPVAALRSHANRPERIRDDIVLANDFAAHDAHRAATHNKGIMNGIDAVAIATGNDWRAIEAGAHAWAARDGRYRSLTRWSVDGDGNLAGELTLPLKVGTVGGSLRSNPAAVVALALSGACTARELAQMMAAVGLAQNFAALRALVTEGIQKGHMRLHARSVAASVGTPPQEFDRVVNAMIESGEIREWKAAGLLMDRPRMAAERVEPVHPPQGTAWGKVILLGEHAAVYDRHVLALPIERAAHASIREVAGQTRLLVNEPGRSETFVVSGDAAGGGVAGMLAFIMSELGLAGRHFDVHLDLRIPTAMGLGSSAAASVAIVRAFDAAFDLELDDAQVDRIAFACEKLAHGNPSGIDNTLATYGRPVLFRRGATPSVRRITLAGTPPLVIAASGIRGITREQVDAVEQRHRRMQAAYDALFDQIDALTRAGAEALAKGDYDTLGGLMNVCHGLLNAMQVSTPELERMVDIARAHGAVGAKLTGAGGGGSIVALCPGRVDRVARALEEAGYRIVSLAVPA